MASLWLSVVQMAACCANGAWCGAGRSPISLVGPSDGQQPPLCPWCCGMGHPLLPVQCQHLTALRAKGSPVTSAPNVLLFGILRAAERFSPVEAPGCATVALCCCDFSCSGSAAVVLWVGLEVLSGTAWPRPHRRSPFPCSCDRRTLLSPIPSGDHMASALILEFGGEQEAFFFCGSIPYGLLEDSQPETWPWQRPAPSTAHRIRLPLLLLALLVWSPSPCPALCRLTTWGSAALLPAVRAGSVELYNDYTRLCWVCLRCRGC